MTVHSIIAWILVMGLGLAGAVFSASAKEPLGLLGAAAIQQQNLTSRPETGPTHAE